MNEPTLQNPEALINALNDAIKILKKGKIKDKKKIKDGHKELPCKCRKLLCSAIFENEKNCPECWVNWFVNYHLNMEKVNKKRVKKLLGENDNNELFKSSNYLCYQIIFSSMEKKDLKEAVKLGKEMIARLEV